MGEREERTIWAKTLRDRVGRATTTQSMFGMSAPSVKIANPFQNIRFACSGEAKSTNRNSQEPDILPP